MPPRVLLHHDPVDTIAERLSAQNLPILRPADRSTARDALRWLAIRVPVGSLGQQDGPEVRAAILLDCVVKSTSASSAAGNEKKAKYTDAQWAKAASVKLTTFRKLHTAIGHYYHDFRTARSKKTPQNKRKAVGEATVSGTATVPGPPPSRQHRHHGSTAAANNHNYNTARQRSRRRGGSELPENIFPSLAIRLAGHLADPNGTARRATIFFHQMYAHVMDALPTAVDKRGQQHDFCRYWTAYQAAVLYTLAVREPQGDTGRTRAASTTATTTASNTRQHRGDDETAVRPLKLEDLVRAADCTHLELREKLVCVETWAREMHANGSRRVPSLPPSPPSAPTRTTARTDHPNDNNASDMAAWKASILESALARARAAATDDDSDTTDRSTLLQRAADAILAEHGVDVVEENERGVQLPLSRHVSY